MTIESLLDRINEEKPNTFTDEKIISFINEVEMWCGTWLNMDKDDIPVYTDSAEDLAKECLIPAPYDCLYLSFLKAKVDYTQEEYPSYQLNMEQFEQDAANALDWIVRSGQTVERRQMPYRFRNIF